VSEVLLQVTQGLSPELPRVEFINRALALNIVVLVDMETLEIYKLIGDTLSNISKMFPELTRKVERWVDDWSTFWRPPETREILHPEVNNWFSTIGNNDYITREDKKEVEIKN